MKCFWGKGMGILLTTFGFGIVLSLIMPLRLLIFILAVLVIYIGVIIFRIG